MTRGGGVGGVRLCLPVRAPGPPGLFCCDACVLSLAWLESLHLMVYSYSAVQDAVPWGSSNTQYVCEEVTERRSEPQFFILHGRSKCFALVVRFGTTIVFKDDHRFSLILSPHADRCFIAVKQGLFFLNYNSTLFYSVDSYPFLFFPRFILCSCILCFPFSLDFHFYSSSASTPWIPVVFLSFSGKRIVNKYSSCPSIKERCGANTEKKVWHFEEKFMLCICSSLPRSHHPFPQICGVLSACA